MKLPRFKLNYAMYFIALCCSNYIPGKMVPAPGDRLYLKSIAREDFFADSMGGIDENQFKQEIDWGQKGATVFGMSRLPETEFKKRWLFTPDELKQYLVCEPNSLSDINNFLKQDMQQQVTPEQYKKSYFNKNKYAIALYQGRLFYLTFKAAFEIAEEVKKTDRNNKKSDFTIIFDDPAAPEHADVVALVAVAKNKQANFQVASTFWGPLEGGRSFGRTVLSNSNASRADGLHTVRAQGELISLATTPSMILRKYFIDVIFYLEKLQKKGVISVKEKNREAEITDIRFDHFQDKAGKKLISGIKSALHTNVVVSYGFNSYEPYTTSRELNSFTMPKLRINLASNGFVDESNTQLVNLVFSSALDLRPFKDFFSADDPKAQTKLGKTSRLFLMCSYLSAHTSAYVANYINNLDKPLYLTLMGAGSFRNYIGWNADVLELLYMDNTKGEDLRLAENFPLDTVIVFRADKKREKNPRTVDSDKYFIRKIAQIAERVTGRDIIKHPCFEGALDAYLEAAYEYNTKTGTIGDFKQKIERGEEIINKGKAISINAIIGPQKLELKRLEQEIHEARLVLEALFGSQKYGSVEEADALMLDDLNQPHFTKYHKGAHHAKPPAHAVSGHRGGAHHASDSGVIKPSRPITPGKVRLGRPGESLALQNELESLRNSLRALEQAVKTSPRRR